MRAPSPHVFPKSLFIIAIFVIAILTLMPYKPAKAALIFQAQPVVTTVTNSGHQELTLYPAACSFQSNYYIFYIDSTATPTVYYQTSTDGINWGSPIAGQVLTNTPNTGFSLVGQVAISCNGSTGQLAVAWVDSSAGAGKYHIQYKICQLVSGVVTGCGVQVLGPKSSNGFVINLATGSGVNSIRQLGGHTYYAVTNSGVGRELVVDNVAQLNTTTLATAALDFGQTSTGGLNIAVAVAQASSTSLNYAYSTDGATWSCCTTISSLNGGSIAYGVGVSGVGTTGPSSGIMGSGGTVYVAYSEGHSGGNCLTTSCLEMAKVNIAGTLSRVTIGDVSTVAPALITGDGGQNFEIIVHSGSAAASSLAQSTDGAVTWSIGNFIGQGSIGSGGTIYQQGLSSTYWSATLDAFVLVSGSSAAPFNVYAQIFALSNQGQTGSTTIGSCPTKNTATTTLANSTQYFYLGTALAQETILNVQAEIASVNSGHAASETLYFALYSTPNAGSVAPGNPFFLDNVKTWTLSPTSAPQLLVWATGGNLFGPNVPAGATIGISIIGNSKILVNQSSVSGMFSGASGSVVGTTGTPQSTFTALSTNVAQLYFCANLNFQNIFTTTVTSTSTTTLTGTTITSTFTTTTGTGTGGNFAITNPNAPILLLLLLLPTSVFMGITRNLVGALVGLAIGAIVAVVAGVLSPFFFTGLLIGLVSVAVIARTRDE